MIFLGERFNLRFKNLENEPDIEGRILEIFGNVLDSFKIQPNDVVGLDIDYQGLDKGPILIPFQRQQELKPYKILNHIQRILMSDSLDSPPE